MRTSVVAVAVSALAAAATWAALVGVARFLILILIALGGPHAPIH